jgi:hypothetical protein
MALRALQNVHFPGRKPVHGTVVPTAKGVMSLQFKSGGAIGLRMELGLAIHGTPNVRKTRAML